MASFFFLVVYFKTGFLCFVHSLINMSKAHLYCSSRQYIFPPSGTGN